MARKCSRCNGTGEVKLYTGSWQRCFKCGGDGEVEKRNCTDCGKSLTYCGIYGWFCESCDYVNYDTHAAKHQRGECSGALANQDLA